MELSLNGMSIRVFNHRNCESFRQSLKNKLPLQTSNIVWPITDWKIHWKHYYKSVSVDQTISTKILKGSMQLLITTYMPLGQKESQENFSSRSFPRSILTILGSFPNFWDSKKTSHNQWIFEEEKYFCRNLSTY